MTRRVNGEPKIASSEYWNELFGDDWFRWFQRRHTWTRVKWQLRLMHWRQHCRHLQRRRQFWALRFALHWNSETTGSWISRGHYGVNESRAHTRQHSLVWVTFYLVFLRIARRMLIFYLLWRLTAKQTSRGRRGWRRRKCEFLVKKAEK